MSAPDAPSTILVVDDDARLAAVLADRLRSFGYEAVIARSGPEALRRLDAAWPDLVLLDLMLPGIAGEELAAQIKRRADIPIIVVSAISTSESKVDLLQRYAEDYVTKPFDFEELAARIERVLRRVGDRIPSQALELGPDLTIILGRRTAIRDGQSVGLSPIETRLLATLAANLDRPVSTEALLSRVWSAADDADPAYVWVTVRRLRRKIERDPDDPRYLLTEKTGGYRLAREAPREPEPETTSAAETTSRPTPESTPEASPEANSGRDPA
jgi:DNA-binding response OmpR family regulator